MSEPQTSSVSDVADPSLPVLVGTDGSQNSAAAVSWAAQAAVLRGVPLKVVYCLDHDTILTSQVSRRELDEYAEQLAEKDAERVRKEHPDIEVSSAVRVGPPTQVLVDEAKEHQLLVLGRRGVGGFRRMMMGSTSSSTAHRTTTPLVVVPSDWQPPADGPRPIVVGVDSSKPNERAVQMAFEAARSAGSTLHAVRTWEMGPVFAGDMAGVVGGFDRFEAEARQQLAASLERWIKEYPDVTVEQEVVRGHPVDGLVDAAEGAGLLVIGSHGHRRLRNTTLGSVTRGVLHHANAPVAVIPRG